MTLPMRTPLGMKLTSYQSTQQALERPCQASKGQGVSMIIDWTRRVKGWSKWP
jgi:hypothetical protein